jgi:glutamate-5-semialdehyde dehydrogenase
MVLPSQRHGDPPAYAPTRAPPALARPTTAPRASPPVAARSLDAHRDAILAANAADLARRGPPRRRDARPPAPHARPPRRRVARRPRGRATLPDPLGEERSSTERPNGLRVYRRRIPLGVIAVIYEARPNVTAEAAALTLRSGNAVVLRGGSEALRSNAALADAACAPGSPTRASRPTPWPFCDDPSRARVAELLGPRAWSTSAIPRGGPALMDFVDAHARVPVIRHGAGVCHVYVDRAADPPWPRTSPSTPRCTAPGCATRWRRCSCTARRSTRAPALGRGWRAAGSSCGPTRPRGGLAPRDPVHRGRRARGLGHGVPLPGAGGATVPSLDEAIAHIARHGTEHSARASSRPTRPPPSASSPRSTRRACSGTPPPASTTAASWASARRSASPPAGCTPSAPWARELTAEKFVVRGAGQVRAVSCDMLPGPTFRLGTFNCRDFFDDAPPRDRQPRPRGLRPVGAAPREAALPPQGRAVAAMVAPASTPTPIAFQEIEGAPCSTPCAAPAPDGLPPRGRGPRRRARHRVRAALALPIAASRCTAWASSPSRPSPRATRGPSLAPALAPGRARGDRHAPRRLARSR